MLGWAGWARLRRQTTQSTTCPTGEFLLCALLLIVCYAIVPPSVCRRTYNPEEGRGRKNPATQEQAMAELAEVGVCGSQNKYSCL